MANHKSSLKRIRQEQKRRLHNRYYAKAMRAAVRKLRATTDKAEAVNMYPSVQKMLDKLAKVNIIHKNKASNLKSKLQHYIQKLGWYIGLWLLWIHSILVNIQWFRSGWPWGSPLFFCALKKVVKSMRFFCVFAFLFPFFFITLHAK